MKKTIILLVLFCTISTSFSQAFEGIGDRKLQGGLNVYGYGSGLVGTFDYGITKFISLGAGAEFYFNNNDNDNFFIFGRGNFHLGELLNLPREMDLYPGINLGVHGDSFGLGAHLGYRYFFTDNLGAFVEIGSHGSLGISYSF